MVSLSLMVSMIMYTCGFYIYSSSRKHLLMLLLGLEYMVLSIFVLVVLYLMFFMKSLFFLVLFLVLSVCEGSLGLSILVSMVRSHGSDFFNSFSLMW
uniref:NADH-ubiquinone oxidoreductase chain 4L n=1 Tax=Pielomastax zhengi TaxID=997267 RepID=G8DZA2_9ORTH|nr:NADH dehydrogenase subunit 4L [Pielomastax zhengi]ADZ62111.1 NADH dehydrogenase subunit 4L [Pielomastax zhengi]